MPAHRTPNEVAKLTGADRRNPKRFAKRIEPSKSDFPNAMDPLGSADTWLNKEQATSFELIRKRFPWLRETDRIAAEMAALLYARMRSGEVLSGSLQGQLRALIGSFGGDPGNLQKIGTGLAQVVRSPEPSEGEAKKSPGRFFQ